MGYTMFYEEAKKENPKINWKDILSESRRKHSKEEIDYAMVVGTSIRPVNEGDMLRKWHKPWLWYQVLKWGLALVALLFATTYGCIFVLGFVTTAQQYLLLMLPPVIVPVVVMVFFWELNIPQNISLRELITYFLVGGILSFVVTSVMFLFVTGDEAFWAPLREEPGKLLPGILFLWMIDRKKSKKIYGMTGLVIGGAVGAGFSGFESVSYAMEYGVGTEILRMVVAIGGHMAYCAPYTAALAMAIHKKGKFSADCLLDRGFLISFLISNAFHAFWNYSSSLLLIPVQIVLVWIFVLYWVRKCLNEAVQEGYYVSGSGEGFLPGDPPAAAAPAAAAPAGAALQLTCVAGPQQGLSWSSGGQALLIGRDPGCSIPIAEGTQGVSRQHCSIQRTPDGWTIRDMNATYGTYLSGGRLAPGQEAWLKDGEFVYLGSEQVCFRVSIQ